MQVSREEFLQEMKLRKLIREHISVVIKEEEEVLKEEQQLRSVIRKLILEQEGFTPVTTSQRFADETMRSISQTVLDDFEQVVELEAKESFRKHFMSYLKDGFEQKDTEQPDKLREDVGDEINVSLGPKEPSEELIIPPEDERPSEEEIENKKREIPGTDYSGVEYTGMKKAVESFEAVENQLFDQYSKLTGNNREEFKDLITRSFDNYFENWMSYASSPDTA